MYIDIKVSVWQRVYINDSKAAEKRALKTVKTGIINDLFDDAAKISCSWETMHDTEKYLEPKDNDGASTIEVYDDSGELLYTNEGL